jgi:dolichol-phosphate mannosyltransferase
MIQNKTLRQFIGFAIVGSIAAGIDLGIMYILTEYLGIWYFYSAIISFSIAIIVNYILNKFLNFKDTDSRIGRQFGMFMGITFVGLIVTQIILYILVTFLSVWYMLAKASAICIVTFFNFYAQRRLTFKDN